MFDRGDCDVLGPAVLVGFLPRWAGFMPARPSDVATPSPRLPEPAGSERRRSTDVDPDPWAGLVPWFLAQVGRPPITAFGRRGSNLDTVRMAAADGSWCEVGPAVGALRDVREGGPTDLWRRMEAAHVEWAEHGSPGWERVGLSVDTTGEHRVWLDEPGQVLRTLRP